MTVLTPAVKNQTFKGFLRFKITGNILELIFSVVAVSLVIITKDKFLLVGIAVFISIVSFFAISFGKSEEDGLFKGWNWGLLYSAISYLILLLIFFDGYKWIITTSIMLFAFSDTVAAFAESSFSKKYFFITSDKKSVIGLLTFTVISFVVLLISGYWQNNFIELGEKFVFEINSYFIIGAVVITLMITTFEAISSKGFGNLIIPLSTAYFVYIFFYNTIPGLLQYFIIGAIIAALVAEISYKVKFLTLNGSVATFLLAGFIFGLGGLKWSVPMLTFFILSSLLSKLRKNSNEEVETYFEKTGVRDYMQVIANGGLGGVLVILNSVYYNDLFFLVYLSTLAAVCADTWATEIGTWRKTVTYNILNFQKTTQGISGGISLPGTAGAFLGSFVISLSGVYWIHFDIVLYFILVLFAGVFGSFFDSFLGATIQAQHKCLVCEKITERKQHCGENTKHFKGLIWVNNDLVNMLAGLAGAGILLLFKSLVKI